jgi:hypothetical protein
MSWSFRNPATVSWIALSWSRRMTLFFNHLVFNKSKRKIINIYVLVMWLLMQMRAIKNCEYTIQIINIIREKSIYIYILWGTLLEFYLSTPWWTHKYSIRSSCSPTPALETTFTTKDQLVRWIEIIIYCKLNINIAIVLTLCAIISGGALQCFIFCSSINFFQTLCPIKTQLIL